MSNISNLTQIAGTGLLLGERHPRANTDFKGDMMIAEVDVWRALEADPRLSFADADESDGFCIVFPHAEEATCIREAQDWWAA